jgi:hypothetical protein
MGKIMCVWYLPLSPVSPSRAACGFFQSCTHCLPLSHSLPLAAPPLASAAARLPPIRVARPRSKTGKVVIVLRGRYAGRKAVVVKAWDDGQKPRQFGHAVLVS